MGQPIERMIMNPHKLYLQSKKDELHEIECRFDFIPNFTNQGAITKSLNKLCYHKTLEIARLKGLAQPSHKHEKTLAECRDYAVSHKE